MKEYFTGKFSKHKMPLLSLNRDEAEIFEDGACTVTITGLLDFIYGEKWEMEPANEEDQNFNFIVYRGNNS